MKHKEKDFEILERPIPHIRYKGESRLEKGMTGQPVRHYHQSGLESESDGLWGNIKKIITIDNIFVIF